MDRFEAMRTLVAAVDGGSLSAASRTLAVPLPAVSRRVSDLEALLGSQLVVRTSRKLLLTESERLSSSQRASCWRSWPRRSGRPRERIARRVVLARLEIYRLFTSFKIHGGNSRILANSPLVEAFSYDL